MGSVDKTPTYKRGLMDEFPIAYLFNIFPHGPDEVIVALWCSG